jgi:hypothetical protein
MTTLPPQLRIIAIALIASTCALSYALPPALAGGIAPILAGVQLKKADGGRTTFLSTDPGGGGVSTYELMPSETSKSATVGVNMPSLTSGSLSSQFGSFQFFSFIYEVLDGGPSADSGLRYYLQTDDGFLHTATSTSYLIGLVPPHGVNPYQVSVYGDQFSPAITTQTANTISIRYAKSPAGTIYFTSDTVVQGSNLGSEIGGLNTKNDTAFNN